MEMLTIHPNLASDASAARWIETCRIDPWAVEVEGGRGCGHEARREDNGGEFVKHCDWILS